MPSSRKEVERLVKEAERQGRESVDDKVLLRSPDRKTIVTLHWTPSDRRWRQNAYRDIRRGGFVKPPRAGRRARGMKE